MLTYKLKTVTHLFIFTIAYLTDEWGGTHEFKGRTQRQAVNKAFDDIGKEKARIITDDYSLVNAKKLGDIPLNIEVRHEVASR